MKERTIHKSHISKVTNHKHGTNDILALGQTYIVVGNQVEIENCDERDVSFSVWLFDCAFQSIFTIFRMYLLDQIMSNSQCAKLSY